MKTELIEWGNAQLHYRLHGEGDNLLLFLHGAAADSRIFHSQLRHPFPGWRVAAIDLPDHGKSTGAANVDLPVYGEAVRVVTDHLSPERLVLAGHSMAGPLLLQLCSSLPSLVGLIFLASAPHFRIPEIDPEKEDSFVRAFVHRAMGRYATLLEEMIDYQEIKKLLLRDLSLIRGYRNESRCTLPSLLIRNERDPMVPEEDSDALLSLCQGMKICIVEGEGHVPFLSDAQEVNAAIDRFLKEIDAGSIGEDA